MVFYLSRMEIRLWATPVNNLFQLTWIRSSDTLCVLALCSLISILFNSKWNNSAKSVVHQIMVWEETTVTSRDSALDIMVTRKSVFWKYTQCFLVVSVRKESSRQCSGLVHCCCVVLSVLCRAGGASTRSASRLGKAARTLRMRARSSRRAPAAAGWSDAKRWVPLPVPNTSTRYIGHLFRSH